MKIPTLCSRHTETKFLWGGGGVQYMCFKSPPKKKKKSPPRDSGEHLSLRTISLSKAIVYLTTKISQEISQFPFYLSLNVYT